MGSDAVVSVPVPCQRYAFEGDAVVSGEAHRHSLEQPRTGVFDWSRRGQTWNLDGALVHEPPLLLPVGVARQIPVDHLMATQPEGQILEPGVPAEVAMLEPL